MKLIGFIQYFGIKNSSWVDPGELSITLLVLCLSILFMK